MFAGGSEALIYATIMGGIGAFLPFVSKEDIDFFYHLEMQMRSELPPLCGREHLSYRSYYFPVKVQYISYRYIYIYIYSIFFSIYVKTFICFEFLFACCTLHGILPTSYCIIHIYTYTHIHIYTYTHIHIYTYTHIHIYTYTHIHIRAV